MHACLKQSAKNRSYWQITQNFKTQPTVQTNFWKWIKKQDTWEYGLNRRTCKDLTWYHTKPSTWILTEICNKTQTHPTHCLKVD